MADRMDLREKFDGLESRIEARLQASIEDKMGHLEVNLTERLLTEIKKMVGKTGEEEEKSFNCRESGVLRNGSDSNQHALEEYPMAVKKVECQFFAKKILLDG